MLLSTAFSIAIIVVHNIFYRKYCYQQHLHEGFSLFLTFSTKKKIIIHRIFYSKYYYSQHFAYQVLLSITLSIENIGVHNIFC